MDTEIELEQWTNATLFHRIHGWANCSISPFALESFQVILTLPFASYICLAILKVPEGMGCHCTVIEDCPHGGFRW
ncbi:hypothetical protein Peur_055248 [Populus x canadensis]